MNFIESSMSISGIINKIIKALTWMAYLVILLMLIIIVGNIIGRFFFNKPLLGTVELVELGMVIIGFFAMPYATMTNANVKSLDVNLILMFSFLVPLKDDFHVFDNNVLFDWNLNGS